jgi:hypothetical protein
MAKTNPNPNTPKLSDTQLVLLSSASQREDGLLTLPANLKGGAARKVVDKLLGLNLVKEVAAKPNQPAWRTDENEHPVGLKITGAGLEALGIEPGKAEEEIDQPSPERWSRRAAAAAKAKAPAESPPDRAPPSGSKQALIVSLLRRPKGATLDDLTAKTGWLPHTTRAALTGLRKKGYELDRQKNGNGRTVYRIAGSAAAAVPVQAN